MPHAGFDAFDFGIDFDLGGGAAQPFDTTQGERKPPTSVRG